MTIVIQQSPKAVQDLAVRRNKYGFTPLLLLTKTISEVTCIYLIDDVRRTYSILRNTNACLCEGTLLSVVHNDVICRVT